MRPTLLSIITWIVLGLSSGAIAATDALTAAKELGIVNARTPTPGLLTAGQLSAEQVTALAREGYRRFISLRAASEEGAGWEEQQAHDLNIEFVRIPVAGFDGINRENATLLKLALAQVDGPVVLYCGSSNRAGTLLGYAAFALDGRGADEALAIARAAGMTGLEPKLVELMKRETSERERAPAEVARLGAELATVIIDTTDMVALARFYAEALGLPPFASKVSEHLGQQVGATYLGFSQRDEVASSPGPVQVWFTVDDLEATFGKLVKMGARVRHAPTAKPWGARVAAVYDPDGNVLGLSQRASP